MANCPILRSFTLENITSSPLVLSIEASRPDIKLYTTAHVEIPHCSPSAEATGSRAPYSQPVQPELGESNATVAPDVDQASGTARNLFGENGSGSITSGRESATSSTEPHIMRSSGGIPGISSTVPGFIATSSTPAKALNLAITEASKRKEQKHQRFVEAQRDKLLAHKRENGEIPLVQTTAAHPLPGWLDLAMKSANTGAVKRTAAAARATAAATSSPRSFDHGSPSRLGHRREASDGSAGEVGPRHARGAALAVDDSPIKSSRIHAKGNGLERLRPESLPEPHVIASDSGDDSDEDAIGKATSDGTSTPSRPPRQSMPHSDMMSNLAMLPGVSAVIPCGSAGQSTPVRHGTPLSRPMVAIEDSKLKAIPPATSEPDLDSLKALLAEYRRYATVPRQSASAAEEETYVTAVIRLRRALDRAITAGLLRPATSAAVPPHGATVVYAVFTPVPPAADGRRVGRKVKADSRITLGLRRFNASLLPPTVCAVAVPTRYFSVLAKVCSSVLGLGQSNLQFGTLNKYETKKNSLVLLNRSEVPLLYSIKASGSIASNDIMFSDPLHGVIEPYKVRQVGFMLRPGMGGTFREAVTVVNVLDRENSQVVQIKANVRSLITFSLKSERGLDFGNVCAGYMSDEKVTMVEIANTSTKPRRYTLALDTKSVSFAQCRIQLLFNVVGIEVHILSEEAVQELEKLDQKMKIAKRKNHVKKEIKIREKIRILRSGSEETASEMSASEDEARGAGTRQYIDRITVQVGAGKFRRLKVTMVPEMLALQGEQPSAPLKETGHFRIMANERKNEDTIQYLDASASVWYDDAALDAHLAAKSEKGARSTASVATPTATHASIADGNAPFYSLEKNKGASGLSVFGSNSKVGAGDSSWEYLTAGRSGSSRSSDGSQSPVPCVASHGGPKGKSPLPSPTGSPAMLRANAPIFTSGVATPPFGGGGSGGYRPPERVRSKVAAAATSVKSQAPSSIKLEVVAVDGIRATADAIGHASIDFGPVEMLMPLKAAFDVINTGDRPLKFTLINQRQVMRDDLSLDSARGGEALGLEVLQFKPLSGTVPVGSRHRIDFVLRPAAPGRQVFSVAVRDLGFPKSVAEASTVELSILAEPRAQALIVFPPQPGVSMKEEQPGVGRGDMAVSIEAGPCVYRDATTFAKVIPLVVRSVATEPLLLEGSSTHKHQIQTFSDAGCSTPCTGLELPGGDTATIYIGLMPQLSERALWGGQCREIAGGVHLRVTRPSDDAATTPTLAQYTVKLTALVGKSSLKLSRKLLKLGSRETGGTFVVRNPSAGLPLDARLVPESGLALSCDKGAEGTADPVQRRLEPGESMTVEARCIQRKPGLQVLRVAVYNLDAPSDDLGQEVVVLDFADERCLVADSIPTGSLTALESMFLPTKPLPAGTRMAADAGIGTLDFGRVCVVPEDASVLDGYQRKAFSWQVTECTQPPGAEILDRPNRTPVQPRLTFSLRSTLKTPLKVAPFSDLSVSVSYRSAHGWASGGREFEVEPALASGPNCGLGNADSAGRSAPTTESRGWTTRACGPAVTLPPGGSCLVEVSCPPPMRLSRRKWGLMRSGELFDYLGTLHLKRDDPGIDGGGRVVKVLDIKAAYCLSIGSVRPLRQHLGIIGYGNSWSAVPFSFDVQNKSEVPLVFTLAELPPEIRIVSYTADGADPRPLRGRGAPTGSSPTGWHKSGASHQTWHGSDGAGVSAKAALTAHRESRRRSETLGGSSERWRAATTEDMDATDPTNTDVFSMAPGESWSFQCRLALDRKTAVHGDTAFSIPLLNLRNPFNSLAVEVGCFTLGFGLAFRNLPDDNVLRLPDLTYPNAPKCDNEWFTVERTHGGDAGGAGTAEQSAHKDEIARFSCVFELRAALAPYLAVEVLSRSSGVAVSELNMTEVSDSRDLRVRCRPLAGAPRLGTSELVAVFKPDEHGSVLIGHVCFRGINSDAPGVLLPPERVAVRAVLRESAMFKLSASKLQLFAAMEHLTDDSDGDGIVDAADQSSNDSGDPELDSVSSSDGGDNASAPVLTDGEGTTSTSARRRHRQRRINSNSSKVVLDIANQAVHTVLTNTSAVYPLRFEVRPWEADPDALVDDSHSAATDGGGNNGGTGVNSLRATPPTGSLAPGTSIKIAVDLLPGTTSDEQYFSSLAIVDMDSPGVGLRIDVTVVPVARQKQQAHRRRAKHRSSRSDSAVASARASATGTTSEGVDGDPADGDGLQKRSEYVGAERHRSESAPVIRLTGATPLGAHGSARPSSSSPSYELDAGQCASGSGIKRWDLALENTSTVQPASFRIYAAPDDASDWLSLSESTGELGVRRGNLDGSSQAVVLSLSPGRPGSYITFLIVENLDNPGDLKVIRVTMDVHLPLPHPDLAFKLILPPASSAALADVGSGRDGKGLVLDLWDVFWDVPTRRRSFVLENTSDNVLRFSLGTYGARACGAEVNFTTSFQGPPVMIKGLEIPPRQRVRLFVIVMIRRPSGAGAAAVDSAGSPIPKLDVTIQCKSIRNFQRTIAIRGVCRSPTMKHIGSAGCDAGSPVQFSGEIQKGGSSGDELVLASPVAPADGVATIAAVDVRRALAIVAQGGRSYRSRNTASSVGDDSRV